MMKKTNKKTEAFTEDMLQKKTVADLKDIAKDKG